MDSAVHQHSCGHQYAALDCWYHLQTFWSTVSDERVAKMTPDPCRQTSEENKTKLNFHDKQQHNYFNCSPRLFFFFFHSAARRWAKLCNHNQASSVWTWRRAVSWNCCSFTCSKKTVGNKKIITYIVWFSGREMLYNARRKWQRRKINKLQSAERRWLYTPRQVFQNVTSPEKMTYFKEGALNKYTNISPQQQ